MNLQNITVNINVSFDETKVESLVEEFKQRLINECMIVTTGKPTSNVTNVTINVEGNTDVKTTVDAMRITDDAIGR